MPVEVLDKSDEISNNATLSIELLRGEDEQEPGVPRILVPAPEV
jgi:hypothetical protein